MPRKLQGTVVSDVQDKTVVVAVASVKEHPIYRKKFKSTVRFQAHDETNQYKVGDLVEITESKPISRHKRWVATRKLTSQEVQA